MKKIILVIPVVILAFGLNFFQTSESNNVYVKDSFTHNRYIYQIMDRECSYCHNDKLKHKVMHAPVTDDCESCHQTTGEKHPRAKVKGFVLAEKTPDLCYICHEAKNDKKNIHAPVDEGCSSCHSPHGSKYQSLLAKPTSSLVCAECHDLNLTENMNIHAPIELDGCQSCHDSHQSDYSHLLVEEKSKLCINCHDNIETEKQEKYIHAPFEDDCSNCHNPHSSKEDHLLNMKSSDLCFSCHDDIGEKLKQSKHIHGIINQKNNCHNCHSPHASSHNKLLVKEQSDLCFKCHHEEIITSSKTIENIKETIQNSKYIHAAIEGGCNTCHDPHASDNNSILVGAFPAEEYAKASVETFELCFNCHDSELLEKEFSNTATNFRNRDQNLHFVHITGEKGRNCNICHDMHASKNKYLIRKRIKYGSWDMPMNFLLKENGASCRTGCHTEKEYTREVIPEQNDSVKIVNNDIADSDSIITDTTQIVEHIQDVNNNQINDVTENQDTVNILTENKTENLDTSKVILIDDENMLIDTTTLVINDTVNNNVITVIKETIINVDVTDTIDIVNNSTDINTNPDSSNIIVIEENTIPIDTTQVTDIIADVDEINVKDTIQETIGINTGDNLSAIEEFKKMTPLRMFFLFAKTDFEKNADEEIKKLVSFMNKYTGINIQIEGHTDNIGSIEYNKILSNKRAKAIQKILIAKGILPKRIKIVGKGEDYPIDTNKTEQGRANNRRVEFKLLKY